MFHIKQDSSVGFFSKLFGSSKPKDFDVQSESVNFLKELPPCTDFVVIASPRYSGSYRAEVIAESRTVAAFLESISNSSFGGSHSVQVARVAMPIWLRSGEKHSGSGYSYLPKSFFNRVAIYVQDFVSRGEAVVHCPDCNSVVSGVNISRRNEQRNVLHSEWTTEWRCPKNHLLYTEDHEIEWMRRPSTEAFKVDPIKSCSEFASKASIEVVLDCGKFSCFIIDIGGSADDFMKAISNRDALRKFVSIVELRIKHRDFLIQIKLITII
jgi:hypothetical protein